jgi:hypothetical protein
MLVKKIMKVLSNLLGLNKKINASEIALKENGKAITLDEYLNKNKFTILHDSYISSNITITIKDSPKNYDFLLFVCKCDSGGTNLYRMRTTIVPTNIIKEYDTSSTTVDPVFWLEASGSSYHSIRVRIVDKNITIQDGSTDYFGIRRIYGINL